MKKLFLLFALFAFVGLGTAQAQCPHAAKAAKTKTTCTKSKKKCTKSKATTVATKTTTTKKACAGKTAGKKCCKSKGKASTVSTKSCAGKKSGKKCCKSKAVKTSTTSVNKKTTKSAIADNAKTKSVPAARATAVERSAK